MTLGFKVLLNTGYVTLSAILPLFWRHDITNTTTFAAKTWEVLLWRHEIHVVFPRNLAYALLVMVHNPAHDLFSIGHFLCRVRVVGCCDLRNGAERQWFIVATISGNFFLLKSLLAGTTTVMHRYWPNDTYPCVFNMKRTTYPYLFTDFYDASQFEMINVANVYIEHYNSDPVISLFGNMQIMIQYMEYDVKCIN